MTHALVLRGRRFQCAGKASTLIDRARTAVPAPEPIRDDAPVLGFGARRLWPFLAIVHMRVAVGLVVLGIGHSLLEQVLERFKLLCSQSFWRYLRIGLRSHPWINTKSRGQYQDQLSKAQSCRSGCQAKCWSVLTG